MKTTKQLCLMAGLLLWSAISASAQQMTTFNLKGKVVYVEDRQNRLGNSIKVGDPVGGFIQFDQAATDNNSDPTVGDYWYDKRPSRIRVRINQHLFITDPKQTKFLVELVNRSPEQSGDAIVFRSYKNIFPIPFEENHISWQLDDHTGAALSDVNLPAAINLAAWKQDFALTITGESFSAARREQGIFIRVVIKRVWQPPATAAKLGVDLAKADETNATPTAYALAQNHPNPFWSGATSRFAGNPATTIGYALPEEALVSLRIYDVLGREIRTLVDDFEAAGVKSVIWDSKDNLGREVGAGFYLYRLEADDFTQTRKLLLVK